MLCLVRRKSEKKEKIKEKNEEKIKKIKMFDKRKKIKREEKYVGPTKNLSPN